MVNLALPNTKKIAVTLLLLILTLSLAACAEAAAQPLENLSKVSPDQLQSALAQVEGATGIDAQALGENLQQAAVASSDSLTAGDAGQAASDDANLKQAPAQAFAVEQPSAVEDPSQSLSGNAQDQPASEPPAPAVQAAAPAAQPDPAAQAASALESKPQVGFLAPDFTLQTLDGQPVHLADLRGKAVMLNYWATWCNPCKAELPVLQKLQAEYAAQNVLILTINAIEQDNLGDLQALVGEMGLTLPVLLDANNQVQSAYEQLFFPTSYYIDPSGVIRYIKLGDAPEADIRIILDKLARGEL